MTILLYTSIFLFLLICTFLILLVLIQKGRGGGLTSAFGGAGGNTAFGSKTGDVLTWVTSVVFGLFLVLAVALNLLSDYQNRRTAGPAATALPAGQTGPAGQVPPAEQTPTNPPVETTTPPSTQPAVQ